ncbi:MAG: VacJ family lipoprotein [Pseudomonadota bacterium]
MKLRNIRALSIGAALSVLTACASTQPAQDQTDFDPIEPVNRVVHHFNQAVDFVILYPAAMTYGELAPEGMKTSVRSFTRNLGEPLNAFNALFQGDPVQAADSMQRFIMNSTMGLLGFYDLAADFGIPYRKEDFGQTLAHYGIGAGPYIVLPLLGPSNLRDTTGIVADYFMDPVTWAAENSDTTNAVRWGAIGMRAIDARYRAADQLAELERTSIDYYAALRSLYRQNRNAMIRNGAPVMAADYDESASFDFDDDIQEVTAAQ